MKQAVRWGLVTRNVASSDYVDVPSVQQADDEDGTSSTRTKYLVPADAKKLMAAALARKEDGRFKDPAGPLVALMLVTGLRPSEAFALTWADIDRDAGTVEVRRSLYYDRKAKAWAREPLKTGEKGERTLGVCQPALDALKDRKLEQDKDRMRYRDLWHEPMPGLAFTTRTGTPMDGSHFRRSVMALCKEAKVPLVPPYALRHSAASLLLALGVQMKVVQAMLGHSTMVLTADTYSHVAPEVQSEASAKLGEFFQWRRSPPARPDSNNVVSIAFRDGC